MQELVITRETDDKTTVLLQSISWLASEEFVSGKNKVSPLGLFQSQGQNLELGRRALPVTWCRREFESVWRRARMELAAVAAGVA